VAAKITAVFNTTQPGEHPFCGAGILEQTGFPYSPEKLMAVGIKHFNYGWPDMAIPSIHSMMNIVQIAVSEIESGGKIAIHCHAGFGRTGITIACILVVVDNMDGSAAIRLVRDRRPGSIQTKQQQQFVLDFEIYYRELRCVFSVPLIPIQEYIMDKSDEAKTIQKSVMDQQYLLKATERYTDKYRYVHKVLYHISQALSSYRKNRRNIAISSMAIIGFSVCLLDAHHDSAPSNHNDRDTMVHSTVDRWLITPHTAANDDRIVDLVRSIKEDINGNRWERFHMMCDVVSLSDCLIASSSEDIHHRLPSFVLPNTQVDGHISYNSDSCVDKLEKMGDENGDSSAPILDSPPLTVPTEDEPILDEETLTSILPTFQTTNSSQLLFKHIDSEQYINSNIQHHQIKSSSTTKLPSLTPNRSAQQLRDIQSMGSSSVPLFPSLKASKSKGDSDDDLCSLLLNHTSRAPVELNSHAVNESNFGTFNSPVSRPTRAIAGVSNHIVAIGCGAEEVTESRTTDNVTSIDDDARAAVDNDEDDDDIRDSYQNIDHINNNNKGNHDLESVKVTSAVHHNTNNNPTAMHCSIPNMNAPNDNDTTVIALSHLLIDWLQSHADVLLSSNLIAQLDAIWRRALPCAKYLNAGEHRRYHYE